MEREDELNHGSSWKIAVMLLVGLLSLIIIITLTYFTVITAIGEINFCTLWTDIPGRLAIFIISYYVAGICGYFPIPQRYLLNCLPEPVMLWRLETWQNAFRNFLPPLPHLFDRLGTDERDNSESLLVREEHEPAYDSLPAVRKRSQPAEIIYSERTSVPQSAKLAADPPKNGSPDVRKSSGESSMSFDSPIGGYIVPMVKGKSSKPPYLSDQSSLEATSEQTESTNGQREESDTPARTAETEIQLPNYPRFPWGLLRQPGGLPLVARKIHRKNLRIERRETEKYNRIQRTLAQGATARAESPDERGAEGGLTTDDDSNRQPVRLPKPKMPPPYKIRSRRRTQSSTADRKSHARGYSNKSDQVVQSRAGPSGTSKARQTSDREEDQKEEAAQCCENSPNLHWKLEYIRKTLLRIAPGAEAGAAGASGMSPNRQNIEFVSGRVATATANMGIGTSEMPHSSSQKKPSEEPDVKIPISSSEEESQK